MPDPIKITVDGVEVEAPPGELVIETAARSGVYIPRFCYHNRMRPVGMCRMCLVEIDSGRGPALQPACMIPVSDGMKVDTTSERTKKAQDGVLEFLLINHPLDCPVCDRGGECPLQDQTMAYGPGESRFVEEKRHYEKPIAISDLVYLDRERCILCDRCTRFAKEVAGDPLISFQGRGALTEVNTFPDEPFASYFSGNTVQICPVGALTAKPYRFRARPWDLEAVESTCQGCAVGCSMTIESSRNQVMRYLGVDNDAVNWSWLCDRGRFGFEAVNAEDRLDDPLLRSGSELRPARWGEALRLAGETLRQAADAAGPNSIGFIGGARLTNEAAYAWAKLAKSVVGTDNADAQLGDGLPAELVLGLPRATIADACRPGGTIVLLGPDPKETLPVLYLRLRHAIVEEGATLIEVGHGESGLSHLARHRLWGQPGGDLVDLARQACDLVPEGAPVTVVVGRTSLTEDPDVVAEAAAVLAGTGATFLPALRRGNVFGALDAGLAPGLLPGRVSLDEGRARFAEAWGSVPDTPGMGTAEMLAAAAEGRLSVLVLVGADPISDFPDRSLAEAALNRATVIAVDTFLTESSSRADVVLPAAGFAEVTGTTTNIEGRVLRLGQKVTPPGTARADWMIAAELAARLGADFGITSAAELWEELLSLSPVHDGITTAALAANADGLVARGDGSTPTVAAPTITAERRPLDPSALRLVAQANMYDGATLVRHAASLAHLAPAPQLALHPLDFEKLGVEAGAVAVISNDVGRLEAPVVPDQGVVRGTVAVVANLPGAPLNRLLSAQHAVTDVRLEVPR